MSTKGASRYMICAKTLKMFFLHAFQGFGRQWNKIPYKFHLSVMQFTHCAVSMQRNSANEGKPKRFGNHTKILTRNFKVVFCLQPWSDTAVLENAYMGFDPDGGAGLMLIHPPFRSPAALLLSEGNHHFCASSPMNWYPAHHHQGNGIMCVKVVS